MKKFFSGLKNKAMAALLKRQMKNLPPEQQQMILDMIEKNPDLFAKIGKEVEKRTKEGQNQMYATMQVMQEFKDELQEMMKGHDVEAIRNNMNVRPQK